MPQIPVEKNDRISLNIAAQDKSLVMRAATLQHTNLAEFVIRTAVSAAREVIDKNERIELTQRDSLHVLDLLDEPQASNKKHGGCFYFIEVIMALPKLPHPAYVLTYM